MTQVALARAGLLHPALPRFKGPTLAAWGLPFALVLLLAFSGGGYDPLVRAEAGIAVWWLVLVAVCTGVIGLRPGPLGWTALGLLTAFAVWTLLGLSWTESQERTVAEVGRLTTYVGFLALAVIAQRRAGSAQYAVQGAAAAIGIVALAAVLTRLYPQWGAARDLYATFPSARNRLAFPVNYWNLLAVLCAIGLPLLLATATSARSLVARGLAAAGVPVVVLCVFLTISRGGVIAVVVGLVLFVLVAGDRLQVLLTLLTTGAGSALLLVAAEDRDALQAGLDTVLARSQGHALLGLLILVGAGVALLQAAIGLADRHAERPRLMRPARSVTTASLGVGFLVALVVFVAAGGPGQVSDRWDQFKTGSGPTTAAGSNGISRLSASFSGNGRYQYWRQARKAEESEPLHGIGAGTFEFWWARNGDFSGGFVRDAHSLWFETLGETGIVGLALLGGLFLLSLVGGIVRTLREGDPTRRMALAGATAGIAAFATGASYEWAWELPVLPAVLLVLVAVVLVPAAKPRLVREELAGRPDPAKQPARLPIRLGVLAVALAATVAIVIPMSGTASVRDSQRLARANDLSTALKRARDAEAAQPYGATNHLQQALVLEQAGALAPALDQAVKATADEPTNWRTWLIRSRLEARTGDAKASLAAYQNAKSLNPKSPLFDGAKG